MSTPQGNTITFAANGTTSTALAVSNMELVALVVPATWTTSDLTIQGSVDGATFYNIFSGSNPTPALLKFTSFAASQILTFRSDDFRGVGFIKLVAGTSQSGGPVNITAIFRAVS